MILSELGPSIPKFLPMAPADVARHERIFMGLGTVDDHMAVRAQRALLRRLTHRSERRLQGDQAPKPAGAGGVPASHALSVSFSCLCRCSFSETLPHGTAARLPGTTLDEEELDDDEDEDDVPPPLVGEDIIGGVADCAAAVTRERVEPATGRKVNRRRARDARMSCSHGTTSDESDDDVDERPPPPPPGSGVPGSK